MTLEGDAAEFEMGQDVAALVPRRRRVTRRSARRSRGLRGRSIRLQFDAPTIAEQETLTCALYSRANSWISNRDHVEVDRPMVSLGRVIRLSFTGFNQVIHGVWPKKKKRASANGGGHGNCADSDAVLRGSHDAGADSWRADRGAGECACGADTG